MSEQEQVEELLYDSPSEDHIAEVLEKALERINSLEEEVDIARDDAKDQADRASIYKAILEKLVPDWKEILKDESPNKGGDDNPSQ